MIDLSRIKLGLNHKELDPRTLKLSSVMTELPPIPATFNLDTVGAKDKNVFANDKWGDCVIAGRAHQTLRFENYEQGKLLPITDDDVLGEYWMEQGATPVTRTHFCKTQQGWSSKPDNGLDMITSLNAWCKGWKAAGDTYSIDAYGVIDPTNQDHVRAVLYLLNGGYIALGLPLSAQKQTVWDAVEDSQGGAVGSWGYHCVYLTPKVTADGLECVTWGTYQKLTWGFLQKYCVQFFGVVDQMDNKSSILDIPKLQSYLDAVRQN